MMPIGGFFELEVPRGSGPYHPDAAAALTSGRACLRHALSVLAPRRVHLPFYTCDALLEPVVAAGVLYTFYHLDEDLEPPTELSPGPGEVIILINYFGLKGLRVRAAAERLGPALIVDNTQAFYERGYPGCWSFNSARKFFGVPDGAYLYAPVAVPTVAGRNESPAWDHLTARLSGQQAAAYEKFLASEAAVTSEVRRLSAGSERVLHGIEYGAAAARRRANYARYHDSLASWNRLALPLDAVAVPMCYPLLPPQSVDRATLYAQGIYTPTLWKDCVARAVPGFGWERELSDRLLPLPLDQRYGRADIDRVTAAVSRLLGV